MLVQPEGFAPQVNEIPNTMPSWMPGDDYMVNFRKGDPYVKIDEGYARLPGAGYTAIHPELEGVDPEDYPDIVKMRILGDVAPYSREYQRYAGKVRKYSSYSSEVRAEFERVALKRRYRLDHLVPSPRAHNNSSRAGEGPSGLQFS
jgi:hypothetical protein